ncbi:Cgl0159 family (beta/alpha)8-fold protein [Arsenicicoccus sp. UBA7492]|uniref:Cgl0159 family (beta/alpha)8-fold protein n=1 Tax=Arsenicicoccus sp. UBA7492 TaxID=1946057 RepID=UPI00257A1E38|nr:deoxyribose-phosphate aldolase [Arsenicicoccus sp. UBA7492]
MDRVSVDVRALTTTRLREPERIDHLWAARRRRPLVGDDGRLLLVACDHPARGALGVRDDGMAMASRSDTLERLATALSRPGVDGVLGTPDVLEDLLLLGLLDDVVVVGSMNRGGLQGASFELDDRFTAYAAADLARRGLDGGKMLTRVDLADDGTAATLAASARAVTELAHAGLMAMVEPFWSSRGADGRVVNHLDPDSVIRSVHVAAGLGATSARTWLKLPVVDDMARVLDASTMPALLLGGDPTADPEQTYATWADALTCPSAAGLVVGRALLYPPDGDVAAAVDVAAHLVHGDPARSHLAPGSHPAPGSNPVPGRHALTGGAR